jgi:hypothetical protein
MKMKVGNQQAYHIFLLVYGYLAQQTSATCPAGRPKLWTVLTRPPVLKPLHYLLTWWQAFIVADEVRFAQMTRLHDE